MEDRILNVIKVSVKIHVVKFKFKPFIRSLGMSALQTTVTFVQILLCKFLIIELRILHISLTMLWTPVLGYFSHCVTMIWYGALDCHKK